MTSITKKPPAPNDVLRIEKDGVTYALIFRRGLPVEDVRFVTDQTDGLQVGFFERKSGHAVPAHLHKPRTVDLPHIAEFLSIEKGEVRITVFDEKGKEIGEQSAHEGQCILFLRGGHALTVIKDARIMEVKQGPYQPEDKIRLPA